MAASKPSKIRPSLPAWVFLRFSPSNLYYEVVWVAFFLVFKDCLMILVTFVNVDMCKTVLIAGESSDYEFSAAIFIELLKFFCEVLTIIFRMHAYVW